jgi:ankyrin repeat protein
VVQLLLAADASVDQALTDTGTTPLFVAAQKGHSATVGRLIAAGADATLCMAGIGWSPLFVAAGGGHAAVVQQLLDYAPSMRSIGTSAEHAFWNENIPSAMTPLDIAQHMGHGSVMDVLQSNVDASARTLHLGR